MFHVRSDAKLSLFREDFLSLILSEKLVLPSVRGKFKIRSGTIFQKNRWMIEKISLTNFG